MSKQILAIDDDPRLLDALCVRLKAAGYDAYTASSGEDGIWIAQRCRPDAIILDICLPGIDGYEVCRRLRADEKLQRVPIIAISAMANEASLRAIFQAGADRLFPKPYDGHQLIRAIQSEISKGESSVRTHSDSLAHF